MATAWIVFLYLVGVPYLGLMLLVIAGMFRPAPARGRRDAPSVSVVIPAHDEERDLPATLASLQAVRYAGELEFVIVDDRSTDGTRAVIERFAARDRRFRLVAVTRPSRRLSPKVNAVDHGIRASRGEIVLASDADCRYHPGWVDAMVSYFAPDVAMVVGYVETSRKGDARSWLRRFESADWFTLMLTSRSLARFGWKFASSANNLAYRRSAFEAVGGFGSAGRAPSGDEDLLTQAMRRLPAMRVVFADAPEARVLTQPAPTGPALLRQRRRWVSRYHHGLHYHPAFLAGIAVLGMQSVALSLSVVLSPFVPGLAPWVIGLWVAKVSIELVGMKLGTADLDRGDLWGGTTLLWALGHPFFIAAAVIGSFLKPSAWHAGAASYRRQFLRRRVRAWRRRLRDQLLQS